MFLEIIEEKIREMKLVLHTLSGNTWRRARGWCWRPRIGKWN